MTMQRRLRAIAVALAFVVASCAAHESATEAHDGSSMGTAIVLEGITNEIDGVRAEHAEVRRRFPGWQWDAQGLSPPTNGRIYDVITLLKSGQTKTVYFDITDWFGKL